MDCAASPVIRAQMLLSGVTMFGALPVALLVKSPSVLALVSQASVAFVFFFAAVVAALSLAPSQHNGAYHLTHAVAACQICNQAVQWLSCSTILAQPFLHLLLQDCLSPDCLSFAKNVTASGT